MCPNGQHTSANNTQLPLQKGTEIVLFKTQSIKRTASVFSGRGKGAIADA